MSHPGRGVYMGMTVVVSGLTASLARLARVEMRVSQESLAVDADLDRSYLGGIERSEHNLTMMNIVKIAAALQVKPSELLGSAGL